MRLRTVAVLAAGALAVAGCSPTSRDDSTPATLGTDDGEATLVTVVSTVPNSRDLPAAIAADLVDEITGVIGVELTAAQTECVVDAVPGRVDDAALLKLGLGGDPSTQPLDVQADIYGAFDGCVSPRDYGQVAAPLLTAAGAQLPVAQCVFRELRDRLGFAGMYAYWAGTAAIGTSDTDLGDKVTAAYDACDLDPATLTSPISPGGSTTTTSSTIQGDTAPATIASTTVVPPVAPPEDAVVTTTVSSTTTTIGSTTSTN